MAATIVETDVVLHVNVTADVLASCMLLCPLKCTCWDGVFNRCFFCQLFAYFECDFKAFNMQHRLVQRIWLLACPAMHHTADRYLTAAFLLTVCLLWNFEALNSQYKKVQEVHHCVDYAACVSCCVLGCGCSGFPPRPVQVSYLEHIQWCLKATCCHKNVCTHILKSVETCFLVLKSTALLSG